MSETRHRAPLIETFAVAKRIDRHVEPAVSQREIPGLASARDEHSREERPLGLEAARPKAPGALSRRSRSTVVSRMRSIVRLACTTRPDASRSITPSLMASNVVCHWRVGELSGILSAASPQECSHGGDRSRAARPRWSNSRLHRCRGPAACPRDGQRSWRHGARGWRRSPDRT